MTVIHAPLSTRPSEETIHSLAPRLLRSDRGPSGWPVSRTYPHFEVSLDEAARMLFCSMSPPGKPIVTQGLLADLSQIQRELHGTYGMCRRPEELPFSYFVFASTSPGVFNLGGDLAQFAECVRSGDRATIHRYARTCVDIVHRNTQALGLPVITAALVQGDALGGGFETALSFDMIVAERSAKFGLPEILFNLFPGMGAFSLLSRKLDPARAQKLILSGEIYTAAQLHEMGLVDVLAEDGQGDEALRHHVLRNAGRYSAHLAIHQARRLVNPVTLEELQGVVDVWTDAVFRLGEANLRKMERLATAQEKRMARVVPGGRR